MAEVVDFNTKNVIMNTPTEHTEFCKKLLQDLVSSQEELKDLIVFARFTNDEYSVIHTGPVLSDKCLMVSLLQYSINNDIIGYNEEFDLEEDK